MRGVVDTELQAEQGRTRYQKCVVFCRLAGSGIRPLQEAVQRWNPYLACVRPESGGDASMLPAVCASELQAEAPAHLPRLQRPE